MTLTRNGTQGRVYGGDCNLVHVADGKRREAGMRLADALGNFIRSEARAKPHQPLCPGCFMIVLFNCAIELAQRNGQPLGELARTMANAFAKLADNPRDGMTEEIEVILDFDPITAIAGDDSGFAAATLAMGGVR